MYPEAYKRYSDEEKAKMINAYRAKYPNATQTKIKMACGVEKKKLDDLVARGLIDPLPAKIDGRKVWARGFTINQGRAYGR